jgi:hypothetical protein
MLKHWPQELQIGFPNSMVSFFQAWGQHLFVTWGVIENIFFISALNTSVMPLGLISTFAPIEMLDLS